MIKAHKHVYRAIQLLNAVGETQCSNALGEYYQKELSHHVHLGRRRKTGPGGSVTLEEMSGNRCDLSDNKSRTLPKSTHNLINAYSKYIEIPPYNVVSRGVGCVLASIEMLYRLSTWNNGSQFSSAYLQRTCDTGQGLFTFHEALEILMEMSKHPEMMPENEDYSWIGQVKHFRIVTGQKASHVFKKLLDAQQGKSGVAHRGAFAFNTGKGHALCASNCGYLTDKARDEIRNKGENARVFVFNVSDNGSTTSFRTRKWFEESFAKFPDWELMYLDDIEPDLITDKGRYIWNEDGVLYEQQFSHEKPVLVSAP